ncbi:MULTISPECIES: M20/M25/M40 family metallo-hydrolase [unclassified Kaistella]|uniref:M20/M25/M40 family metallo-hydrolase n=1 Tax=unclassified Kaistella TaxID=2762626 RepID=UPI002732D703|nr:MULTISPECIES: M20/M25/M40 family metallo-hydrolase [unclassified Kaistella]MDP2454694.1 M20/M25/M40 family metallo-hydrolase [Kaistella sp. SH11-4b]MDP2457431.1 M20/M25/M40 family metallo-hydrolase [Kaistella sp. SH40-3]MDP2460191.1 M20/M25/M40 family metallo-hydrolase [Kaistella sp. SH19-2b]
MKYSIIKVLPLFLGGFLFAQKNADSIQFKNISDEILVNGTAYESLRDLTQNIGHRLSGSAAYEKATDWAVQKLKEAGADKVWKEEVMVPVWERGKESLQIKEGNGKWKSLKMLSLGNSEGSKGKDVEAEIVFVKNKEDFDKLPDAAIKGKIIFFNYAFNQQFISTGQAYGDAGKYRRSAASWAGKRGAKAVIIRSLSSAYDDVPHTGAMRYDADDMAKIPAVAIGPKSADELEKTLKTQKVIAKLNSNATMKGEKLSHTVIGEITGNRDQSVIVVGGHLDSWDVGEGAQDDGAGIVQSIEVLRTFKKLGIKNNHTIRVVCFANEENGVKGGNQYAENIKKNNEKHLFAIESDGGGFTPRGFGLVMSPEKRKQVQSWRNLFLPYGVHNFELEYAGTDIEPMEPLGVPLAELSPDSQRYFDIHHSEEDTFDKVNRRELLLGAAVMGQLIYMVDKNW